VLPLIRTCYRIALLQKGPEAIPRSWLLLVLAAGLMLYSELAAVVLIRQIDEGDLLPSLVNTLAGVACYAAAVVLAGRPSRLLPTVTALLGCWGLIQLVFVAEFVLLMPVIGARPTGLIADLIRLWSVPVEGHIIARALGRHWYVGIGIAIAVFTLQYILYMVTAS